MLVKPHAHFLHNFSFEFRLVPEYSRSFLTHNYTAIRYWRRTGPSDNKQANLARHIIMLLLNKLSQH